MKIVCAPDSFKGSISATAAAEAMAAGIRRVLPEAVVDLCPVADGGEGTLDAFETALRGDRHYRKVQGPLGEPVDAAFGTFDSGWLAVIEAATAVGLTLVPEDRRDPEAAGSFGVGTLLAAACDREPRRIIVGVGGTATNDGGCGMAQALGVRFMDRRGRPIEASMTGGKLGDIGAIDITGRLPALEDIDVVVASDVRNPLTGPEGAAAVYGPQKGATDEQIRRLDAGLGNLAEIVRRDLGINLHQVAGAGAGGGLGGGLVAFAGAELASGIQTVIEVTDFHTRVKGSDLCLTGEGRIDGQSISGKACMGIAEAAARHGVPTVALVGARGPGADRCLEAGLRDIVVIGEGLPAERSISEAASLLAAAAGRAAKKLRPGP